MDCAARKAVSAPQMRRQIKGDLPRHLRLRRAGRIPFSRNREFVEQLPAFVLKAGKGTGIHVWRLQTPADFIPGWQRDGDIDAGRAAKRQAELLRKGAIHFRILPEQRGRRWRGRRDLGNDRGQMPGRAARLLCQLRKTYESQPQAALM